MAVIKIIEIIGESEKSWEDAVHEGLKRAGKTVKNITGIDVLSFKAKIANNRIVQYRAHMKVAFVVE
ncbi:MAG: dodecin family protein [Candidatus Bilamarchaeaceae archaeon]